MSCGRLVVVAAGAASGKFLKYRGGTRGVGVQTAYGAEVEVRGLSHEITWHHIKSHCIASHHMTALEHMLQLLPFGTERASIGYSSIWSHVRMRAATSVFRNRGARHDHLWRHI